MAAPTSHSRFTSRFADPAASAAAAAAGAATAPQLDAVEDVSKMKPSTSRMAALRTVLRTPSAKSLLVCLFYATSSITLSIVNKAVLSSYDFRCYFLLLTFQLLVGIAFCALTRRLGNPFSIPSVRDPARLRAAVPMSIAFVANVAVGFIALRLVNMPMFFAIRRLTPTFVMALDYLVLGVLVSNMTAGSVVVSFVGTILAGWDTFGSDWLGYALAFANDVATALQLLYQKKFSDGQKGADGRKLSSFGLVYFNAVLALPLCLAGAALTGEFSEFANYRYLDDHGFWGALLLSASLGVVLTYAGVLCTVVNSPLTTSMTGCAKDVVGTAVGAVLFGDFDFTPTSTSGLGLSFVGSFMYVWAGYTESRAGKAGAPGGGKAVESPRPAGAGGKGGAGVGGGDDEEAHPLAGAGDGGHDGADAGGAGATVVETASLLPDGGGSGGAR